MPEKTNNEIISEIEELIDSTVETSDNEIDLKLLKIISAILKSKEQEKKTELEKMVESQIDEILDEIHGRPDFYFDTKERNIEKLINKKIEKNILPKEDEKQGVYVDTVANTLQKLVEKLNVSNNQDSVTIAKIKKSIKMIKETKSGKEKVKIMKEIKQHLNDNQLER